MKLHILFITIFLIFASCKTNSQKQIVKTKSTMYCFYKLDDKYAIEIDSLKIDDWLKTKTDSIIKNYKIKNIFDRNGGGPNNAEWNSATDLYLAVLNPTNKTNSNIKLLINEVNYDRIILKNQNIVWYVIPQKYWKQKIRKIDSTDIKNMYSKAFLKGIRNEEFYPSAPLGYGKILKFDILNDKSKQTKYFHVTYGE